MKKVLLTLFGAIIVQATAFSQTYSAFGIASNGTPYDTITMNQDTLYFNFSNLSPGATGNARFVIYFEGDFGAQSEYCTGYLPGFNSIGQTQPNPFGNDCAPEDSTSLSVSTQDIINLGTSFTFAVETSSNVDLFCNTNRVRVRLEYDYCPFGTPVAYADFTIPNPDVCPLDSPQTLVGTPANGTFVGSGMNGNVFDGSNLSTGNYSITYTATDAIGCITSKTKIIKILSAPNAIDELVCENSQPELDFGTRPFVFAYDQEYTNVIDTAAMIQFPPMVQSPTVYYYGQFRREAYYVIDTFMVSNFAIVDHNNLTGDDRTGIAITDSTVYIVGDNNTGRYDLNLQNGVSLPVRDGILTDLNELKIYSLYNTSSQTMADANMSYVFNANALIELNADLSAGTLEVNFSQPIVLDGNNNQVGIYSGYGNIILHNGTGQYYRVEIPSGNVTDLGSHTLLPYYSENWATWGMAGFDGTDPVIFYRSSNTGKITMYNFTTSTNTEVSDFTDFSDMAGFIVHPTNNRMYFHFEGSTSAFGGSSETLAYTDAVDSLFFYPNGSTGCPNSITYSFNSIDLGADTVICGGDGAYILEAGFGYNAYTWNGVNNNWNIFPVQDSGLYVVQALDDANCIVTDSVVVDVNDCATAGIFEADGMDISLYPVPNNGQFQIQLPLNFAGETVIEVVDMKGNQVERIVAQAHQQTIEMNLTVQPATYLVVIRNNDRRSIKPIVIQ